MYLSRSFRLGLLVVATASLSSWCPESFGQTDAAQPSELEFQERIVAGGKEHFMTVHHLRLRGTQRQIGSQLAEIAQSRHAIELKQLDQERCRARQQFYQQHYPSHWQRALGVADFLDLPTDGATDFTVLPYNYPRIGCTAVFYPANHSHSGHSTMSRNYDFAIGSWKDLIGHGHPGDRPTTADPYVIETYPDQGHPTLVVCAYELLGGALDGINSQGLTVALLQDSGAERPQPALRWQAGLSELEIVRYVLENCANVAEAKQALETISFYYQVVHCHYLIGDREGNSFVWEYSPDLQHRFFVPGNGVPQCVTNHSLHEQNSGNAQPQTVAGNSQRRLKTTQRALDAEQDQFTHDQMKRINRQVAFSGEETQSRTLWHALYDCRSNSLSIDFYLGESENKENRSGYLNFQLRSPTDR